MRSGGMRLGLEAGAAEKYGLHPSTDRELFDFVWMWLEGGGFDPKAEGAAEAYDACMEHHAAVADIGIRMGTRRSEGAASTGASAEAISTGAGFAGKTAEHAAVRVELGDVDSSRQWALTEYLHKTAALERDVMLFRSEVLGAPHKTLSRSEALRCLEEAEIPQGQTPNVPVVLVTLPEGDFGRRFRVAKESVWGRLSALAERFSRKYPWDEPQATAFVLCGDRYSDDKSKTAFTPPIARLGTRKGRAKGHSAHPYNRVVITIEVASWVPAEQVKEAYSKMQRELNSGKPPRPPSLRCIEVFRFVLANSTTETVDWANNLARLALPPWRDLRELWDGDYPPGHSWNYGAQNVRNFRRDFGIGQAAVLGVKAGGLLGIAGEPRTPAQQLECSRKRAEELGKRLPSPRLRRRK